MKRLLIVVALGWAVGASAVPAEAIDSQTFNCEKAVVVELAKFSRARGKCLTKCVAKKQAKPALYSCSPALDAISTQPCADKTLQKYVDKITDKCTGFMPSCGGYEKGWCDNDTSQICDRNFDCGHCSVTMSQFCTLTAQCPGGESCVTLGDECGGRCSTTTTTACSVDPDCPSGETCTSAGVPKDIPDFIAGNLFEGEAGGVVNQIDVFSETLFQCRQSVCSDNGDLCFGAGDCSSGTCTPGKCSNGTVCAYDGECGTGTTKKCLPLGRCTLAATSCRTTADCSSGTCERYGRCRGGSNNGEECFTPADCPDMGGTCERTLVDTTRKAEQNCTATVADAMAKYTFAIATCQAKCAHERDPKDGLRCTNDTAKKCATDSTCGGGLLTCLPTSCDPFATGRCSNDIYQVCVGNTDCVTPGLCNPTNPAPISKALDDCRDKAFTKALAAINKKCPSLPTCGAYAPSGNALVNLRRPEDLLGYVSTRLDEQFKEDVPDLGAGSNFCEP